MLLEGNTAPLPAWSISHLPLLRGGGEVGEGWWAGSDVEEENCTPAVSLVDPSSTLLEGEARRRGEGLGGYRHHCLSTSDPIQEVGGGGVDGCPCCYTTPGVRGKAGCGGV